MILLSRKLCVTSLVALITMQCASAHPQQATDRSLAHPERPGKRKLIIKQGIGNFGEVTPTLYRGAQPNAVGYQELAKMGVNIVVDLRLTGKDEESHEVRKLGMQFVSIPWHCYFPKDKVFARFLMLLRENRGKKIFVHCRYGDDRTGMMIAAYRMAVEGWTPKEAREEMQQFGFHHLVCPSLGPYEKDFLKHLKKNPAFQNFRAESNPGPLY
jgi:tyrosine-protein phosphatase SIW14